MARTRNNESPPQRETVDQRIKFLIKHSQGTMPICMVVKTAAEAAEANAILKKMPKTAKIISVRVDD